MSLGEAVGDPSPGPSWCSETSPVSEGSDELNAEEASAGSLHLKTMKVLTFFLRDRVEARRLIIRKMRGYIHQCSITGGNREKGTHPKIHIVSTIPSGCPDTTVSRLCIFSQFHVDFKAWSGKGMAVGFI